MQTPSDASTMDISPRVISELPILTVCVPCAGKNLEKHSRFGAKLNLIPSNLSQNESASVLNRVSHNKPRALADTGDSHALLLVEPHSPVLGTS